MKQLRVLVYGLKDPIGGVERVVTGYVRTLTAKYPMAFDFLYFGDGPLKKEIEQMGCRVISIPGRKKHPVAYKKAMAAVFENTEYDAVWASFSGLTNIDVLMLAKKYSVPVRIAHSHVSRLYWGNSTLMKYAVKFLHAKNKRVIDRYATHFLACSKPAGEFMFGRTVEVCKNAVDITRFYPDNADGRDVRKSLGIDADAFVAVHVARMCEAKNQRFLLEVFKEMTKKDGTARLVFVGDGELWDDITGYAETLGISDSVVFTGDRDDVNRLLRAADVFLLPSFSEGLGLCAVEAQATGLPCILSDAVPREADISGSAWFLPLGNAALWADTALSLRGVTVADPHGCVRNSGYEINEQAERLYRIMHK